MKRTSFANWPCSIARTIDLMGDWWTPLVLRETFYGLTRFEDMQRTLGIGRNVLAARLQRLVREGLLARRKYQDHPPRFEYRLTDKGRDFFQVLLVMMGWGDKWLDHGRGVPIALRHDGCGRITRAAVVCAECGRPLQFEHVKAELGPGFPAKLASHPAVRQRFGASEATRAIGEGKIQPARRRA